jgi:hypothetical protein
MTAHWDGQAWTIVPSQDTSSTQNNYLYGVTCLADSACWTAGNSTDNTNNDHTLIERGPKEGN